MFYIPHYRKNLAIIKIDCRNVRKCNYSNRLLQKISTLRKECTNISDIIVVTGCCLKNVNNNALFITSNKLKKFFLILFIKMVLILHC